jgi:hypothetical protein
MSKLNSGPDPKSKTNSSQSKLVLIEFHPDGSVRVLNAVLPLAKLEELAVIAGATTVLAVDEVPKRLQFFLEKFSKGAKGNEKSKSLHP